MKRITLDGGFIEYRIGAKGTVELFDFQVEPDKQRQGIGTKLIEAMEREIGKGKTVYLFTRTENERAHCFYEKVGYKRVYTIRNFYTDNYSPIWGMRSGDVVLYLKHL